MSSLQYTKWSLLRQLNATTSTGCLILANLSDEITSEIFLHCLDPFPSYPGSTANPRRLPMLLLHVCRTWKSIALATPGLWTNLNLEFDRIPQALFDGGNLERFIDDCVARTANLPLSLHLVAGYRRREEVARRIPAILQQLSSRIQVLNLSVLTEHIPENAAGFPRLRSLVVKFGYEHDLARIAGKPIRTFATAPQLRQVEMYCRAAPSHFVIPWTNVVVFHIERVSSKECADVLRAAPSLIECTFYSLQFDPDTLAVSHPGLKSLTCSVDPFLQFLTLPALQRLELSYSDGEEAHLPPFLSRSSASLLKFTLTDSHPPPLAAFSSMLALTDLTLFDPSSAYLTEFFGLFDRTKNSHFLPQLQALKFDSCSPYVNTALVDALTSRCAAAPDGGAQLRSFRQCWPVHGTAPDALQGYYRDQGFGAALEELVEKGLEVYIGHQDAKMNPGGWLFSAAR